MSDFGAAAEEAARLLEEAVTRAVAGEKMVAVAFSGGLDSSLLTTCAKRHVEVVACAAYAKGSGDAIRAKEAATSLGVDLVSTELDAELVNAALADLDLPFTPTLMDRSLWCLYRIVSRSARDSGARVILLGQLADELFGGYAKYAEVLVTIGEEAARSMMDADLREYEARGRIRDVDACSRWAEPRFPFGSKEVVEFASELPVTFKIEGGARKAILRRAASILGVPDAQAEAAKKAAQYSSGIQKIVAGSPF